MEETTPQNNKTFDIVSLVENNPLTRFSNKDYESKIIDKIRLNFIESEQQLFVTNFYSYLNYDTRKDFVINLDRIWKWLGYGRIEECKRNLVNNFKENIDYKIEKISKINFPPSCGKKTIDETRGRQGEFILLTVNCFKKLCLKSKTKKADEIHDYYINLEEIMNELVSEESDHLKNQLKIKDQEIKTKNKDHENNLIMNFDLKQVVYLIEIIKGLLYKFGFSNGIKNRLIDHRNEFGKDITLVAVFETVYNREFEIMIKKHPVLSTKIVEKKYKTNQTELIELDSTFTYSDLIDSIESLKKNINGDLIANLIKENDSLKLELITAKKEISDLKFKNQRIELNQHKLDLIEPAKPKKDQYIYQLYDPKDLRLIKTYNTIEEVCNERKYFKDAISQSVGRAVMQNRLYKNHRFWRIKQTDPIKEYEIPKTEEVDRSPKYEQIVKMDQSNILGIYSCVEDAAVKNAKLDATEEEIRKMRKSITNNLSEDGMSYGFKWYRISEVDKVLLDEFLLNHELPEVKINKNMKQVYKYDANNELVSEYKTMTECIKNEKVSDPTLRKHITNGTILNGYYFKFD